MDSVVETFGVMLRRDLVVLMKNMAMSHGFSWNCSNSTGSDTLSVDSSESYKEEVHNFGGFFQNVHSHFRSFQSSL